MASPSSWVSATQTPSDVLGAPISAVATANRSSAPVPQTPAPRCSGSGSSFRAELRSHNERVFEFDVVPPVRDAEGVQ